MGQPAAWVFVAVSAGTLAQAVTGIGLVLICGPALLAMAGPADGGQFALFTSLLLNAALLPLVRREVRYRGAMALCLPVAFISVALGLLLCDAHSRMADATPGAGAAVTPALVVVGRLALPYPHGQGGGASGARAVSRFRQARLSGRERG